MGGGRGGRQAGRQAGHGLCGLGCLAVWLGQRIAALRAAYVPMRAALAVGARLHVLPGSRMRCLPAALPGVRACRPPSALTCTARLSPWPSLPLAGQGRFPAAVPGGHAGRRPGGAPDARRLDDHAHRRSVLAVLFVARARAWWGAWRGLLGGSQMRDGVKEGWPGWLEGSAPRPRSPRGAARLCCHRPPPLLAPVPAGHETTAAVCTWVLFCLMQVSS